MTLIKSSETLNLNGLTPDDLLGVVQARLEMIAYRTLRYKLQMAYLFGFHTRQGINSLSNSSSPLKRTNKFS